MWRKAFERIVLGARKSLIRNRLCIALMAPGVLFQSGRAWGACLR